MMQNQISYQVTELEKENMKLKEQIRLLYEALEKEPEKKPKNCYQCLHYIKHYICEHGRFYEIPRGHCTQGRATKSRNQEDTCKYFELGSFDIKHL